MRILHCLEQLEPVQIESYCGMRLRAGSIRLTVLQQPSGGFKLAIITSHFIGFLIRQGMNLSSTVRSALTLDGYGSLGLYPLPLTHWKAPGEGL